MVGALGTLLWGASWFKIPLVEDVFNEWVDLEKNKAYTHNFFILLILHNKLKKYKTDTSEIIYIYSRYL